MKQVGADAPVRCDGEFLDALDRIVVTNVTEMANGKSLFYTQYKNTIQWNEFEVGAILRGTGMATSVEQTQPHSTKK
jgi:hypothetical protein